MKKNDSQLKGITVQIFGDEYQIASEGNTVDIQRIARYVDEKMKTLAAQHAGRVAKTTLAVLTAMEITSELFNTVQEQHRLAEKAQENLTRLSQLVDERADMPSLLPRDSGAFRRGLQHAPIGRRDSTPIE